LVAKQGEMRLPHARALRALPVVAATFVLTLASPAVARPSSFEWVEATIADVEAAFADGSLTCHRLVQGYLDRIAAYDDEGPALHAVITTAPDALAAADALDATYADRGPVGPLHCVPVLLKDNVDAAGLPTTGGATALAGARPPDDAFVTERIRAAGGIVLGKANLDEFAFGFNGSSSIEGMTNNAYDPTRGAGGSSSGTGAGVAASFALVGIGTDTGGSVRVPSSVGGLVGIRPSLRLVSQDGILPLAHFQDTAGPMCRTVEDCALLLSVIAGFDPAETSGQNTLPLQRDDRAVLLADADEFENVTGVPAVGRRYDEGLAGADLHGVRIGVVRALFGTNPDVVATMDAAIAAMRTAGAVVEDVTVPELSTVTGYSSVSKWEFRDHLTSYLSSWPATEDLHPQTFEQVAASLGYQPTNAATFATYGEAGATRHDDPDYDNNTLTRPGVVRDRLLAAFDHHAIGGTADGLPYSALLYPSVQSPPAVGGPPSTGSNNRLSPFSGFPALSMPAGFTAATETVPALPIGMELLGREFDEPTLLRIAAGYEHAVAGTPLARQAPTFTPELATDTPVVPEGRPAVLLLVAMALVAAAAVRCRRRPAARDRTHSSGIASHH
jgi:amidase